MRLHLSSASHYNPCKQSEQPFCLPLHSSTSCGDILSHDNFVTVWGPFRRWFCHVRLFTLSHGDRTASVVASSSRVRRWRVPLSLWSSSCLDRPHALCDSSKQAYSSTSVLTWAYTALLTPWWMINQCIYLFLLTGKNLKNLSQFKFGHSFHRHLPNEFCSMFQYSYF